MPLSSALHGALHARLSGGWGVRRHLQLCVNGILNPRPTFPMEPGPSARVLTLVALPNLILADPNDQSCDDGGPGSAFDDCTLGSDCTDCGERFYPPPAAPPVSPPPTPPSAPPLGPGYIAKVASACSETCDYAGDGECDDGGPGSAYADCSYGSDCTDCGTRSDPSLAICTSCPLECNNKGAADRDMSNWCLESMWGSSGVCDPSCNNAECDHDGKDCTVHQAVEKCKPLQFAKAATLVTAPSLASFHSKVNVELNIVEMEPFNVALDSATNQWKMEIEMIVSLRWSDPRLSTADCRAKLNEMLTFESDATGVERRDQEDYRALLYLPSLEVNHTALTYLPDDLAEAGAVKNEVRSAKLNFSSGNASGPWMAGGTAPDGSRECTDCVHQTLAFSRNIGIVPALSFATYPFDQQRFAVRRRAGLQLVASVPAHVHVPHARAHV